MKNVIKVQKMIEPEVRPSINVMCPYCDIFTVINQLLTEPSCIHFEDFTLFKRDGDLLSEIDDQSDKVVMCEAVFRLSGSKFPNITMSYSGEAVMDGDEVSIMVKGKRQATMLIDEFFDTLLDDENDDTEYVSGN